MTPENSQEVPASGRCSRIDVRGIGATMFVTAISILATLQYFENKNMREENNQNVLDATKEIERERDNDRKKIKELTDAMEAITKHEFMETVHLSMRKTIFERALKDPWELDKNKRQAVSRFRTLMSECRTLLNSHGMLLSKYPESKFEFQMLFLNMESRLIDLERELRDSEPNQDFFEFEKGRKVHAPSQGVPTAHAAAASPRYVRGSDRKRA